VAFLRREQGTDGAFRSAQYSALRDGYSLSPLALTVLRLAPGHEPASYERGVEFVTSIVEGSVLRSDARAPTYPLYAIAGAVLVLNVDDNARHDARRAVLVQALLDRQLTEPLGYARSDPSHGGFGYSTELVPAPRTNAPADRDNTGNLSATIFAVGALRLSGLSPQHPALRDALGFVQRCQSFAEAGTATDPRFDDGGFFFSPAVDDPNKAGQAGVDGRGQKRFRSYGSMTADGVRGLLQLGLGVDHPRVQAGSAWLERHFDAMHNPGAFPDGSEVRRESAYYYYAWSVAHALRALGKPVLVTLRGEVRWAEALADALIARQSPDGAFRNPYTEMREDDPLIATPLAAAALVITRGVLRGEHRSHRRTRP
jgi:hypothetical protein